jgi:hypothetical protein
MTRLFLLGLALAVAAHASAAPNVTNATQKGSLLVFPDVRIDTENGAAWNTLIRIQNDGALSIDVVCYWMDGNKNRVDFGLRLTANQAVWFDARSGHGTHQVNRFPAGPSNGFDNPYLITPPAVTEALDGSGPYFKGNLACFAVDTSAKHQVKWNHLSGIATVYHPAFGAYDYNAYAFFAPTGFDGAPVGTAGTLPLDGVAYDACPTYQIGQFTPVPVP